MASIAPHLYLKVDLNANLNTNENYFRLDSSVCFTLEAKLAINLSAA